MYIVMHVSCFFRNGQLQDMSVNRIKPFMNMPGSYFLLKLKEKFKKLYSLYYKIQLLN